VPIVRWVEDGTLREQRTEAPGEFVARLSATGEPGRLEVVRPSLEDIYLGLVDALDATADDTEAVAA
jgi:ABC-2 type transport system ATP-binding protein